MRKHIKTPKDLSGITLESYQEFLVKAKGLSGTDLEQLTVSVFCGLNMESVRYISKRDVSDISRDINIMFTIQPDISPVIKIDGKEYGFINDMENMTLGEYADLDQSINKWETMHVAMAVLYRPIKKRINGEYQLTKYEGTEKTEDLMKSIPLEAAMASMVFFYNLGNELLKHSLLCSVKEVQKEVTTLNLPSSTPSTDGIVPYMQSLVDRISELKMPLSHL